MYVDTELLETAIAELSIRVKKIKEFQIIAYVHLQGYYSGVEFLVLRTVKSKSRKGRRTELYLLAFENYRQWKLSIYPDKDYGSQAYDWVLRWEDEGLIVVTTELFPQIRKDLYILDRRY